MLEFNGMRRILLLLFMVTVTFLVPQERVDSQSIAGNMLARMNNLRASQGLHPYELNAALSQAAATQATWMVRTGQVSHTHPDGSTPSQRARAAGYPSSWISENIYMGTNATPETAWQWWLNSSVHYAGITSDHYYDVGIASDTANNQTAYVMVFGNPDTSFSVNSASSSGSSGSEANRRSSSGGDSGAGQSARRGGLPPYVLGIDENGNIRHEVQPGQTLGQIALIYGYDWPDLQMIRDLNNMTEPEGRNLSIGQEVLIPPWDGQNAPTPTGPTPTPSPDDVGASAIQASAEDEDAGETPLAMAAGPTMTPTWTLTPTWTPTREPTATFTQRPWSAATMTPTPGGTAATAATVVEAGRTGTPAAMARPADTDDGEMTDASVNVQPDDDGLPTLLIAAIAVQVIVLVGAGFEFWRRGRRGG